MVCVTVFFNTSVLAMLESPRTWQYLESGPQIMKLQKIPILCEPLCSECGQYGDKIFQLHKIEKARRTEQGSKSATQRVRVQQEKALNSSWLMFLLSKLIGEARQVCHSALQPNVPGPAYNIVNNQANQRVVTALASKSVILVVPLMIDAAKETTFTPAATNEETCAGSSKQSPPDSHVRKCLFPKQ